MLFSEFQQGTGCKDNEYNHKIYSRLELMYMADDSITKEEIYEYGKKLVDNSKTEEELKFEADIKASIAGYKEQITSLKGELEYYRRYLETENDSVYRKLWRDRINWIKSDIRKCKLAIKQLKWVTE